MPGPAKIAQDEAYAPIYGFPDGLNAFDSPLSVPATQVSASQNLRFSGVAGYPEIRLGQLPYLDRSHRVLWEGVRSMWRYRNADGAKKVIMQAGEKVYADSDDGAFDEIMHPTTNDGYVRFAQFRSALLAATEKEDTRLWHSSAGERFMSPLVQRRSANTAGGTSSSGGFLEDGIYHYRFTADLNMGSDYICESYPIGDWINGSFRFLHTDVNLSGGPGDEHYVELQKESFDRMTSALQIARINVYRSAKGVGTGEYNLEQNLYYVGSMSKDDVDAAAAGAVVFTDDGSIPPGRQIRYDVLRFPPRGRFPLIFRNSLFLAHVQDYDEETETWEAQPSRVYASEMGPRGPEIARFSGLRGWDIDPDESRPITGIAGFQDHTLLVFKPDQTWRIRFSNSAQFTSETDVYIDRVSASVGCNAPQTITNVDNAVAWLSGDNAYYYDGNGVHELGGHAMSSVLSSIPAALRPHATADFDPERKEFSIYYAKDGGPYNRYVARFDARFGRWAQDKLERGVGAVLQVTDDDGTRKHLWGLNDLDRAFLLGDYLVVEADSGSLEGIVPGGGFEAIDWSFSTGYIDFGQPHRNKYISRVLIYGELNEAITLHLEVDNRINTFGSTGYSFKFETTGVAAQWDVGEWDVAKWTETEVKRAAIANIQRPVRGKSHRLTFSGASTAPMKISRVVIYYVLEAEGGTK